MKKFLQFIRPPTISREEFEKLDEAEQGARFRAYLWWAAVVQGIISGGLVSSGWIFYYGMENVFSLPWILPIGLGALLLMVFVMFFFETIWEMEKFERFPWADEYLENQQKFLNGYLDDYPEDWDDEDEENPPEPAVIRKEIKFASREDSQKAGEWAIKKFRKVFEKLSKN